MSVGVHPLLLHNSSTSLRSWGPGRKPMLFAELSLTPSGVAPSLIVATVLNRFAKVAKLNVEQFRGRPSRCLSMGRQKGGYIGGRIGDQLRARLDEISRQYGPADTRMLEDALSALADYVEINRAYKRPIKMVFDSDADTYERQLVAEGKEPTPLVKTLVSRAKEVIESKEAAGGKPSGAGRK